MSRRRQHQAAILLLLGFGLVGWMAAASNEPAPIPRAEAKESYLIYSTLLQQAWMNSPKTPYAIAEDTLQASSNSAWLYPRLAAEQKLLYEAQFADLRKKIETPYRLSKSKFKMKGNYTLLDARETRDLLALMLSKSKRPRKYKKFRMLYQLSPVGFNPKHDRAVVYLERICGPLCGGAQLHVMVKAGDQWHDESNLPFPL